MRVPFVFLVCGSISVFGGYLSAQAATFNIPNGDVSALKSAIINSNNNNENDVINLTPISTYTLTTVDNNGADPNGGDGPNGLPFITGDNGHSVTINGNGATLQRSSAGGTPAFRLLEVSGGTLSVSTLTFTNGTAGVKGGGAVFSTSVFANNAVIVSTVSVTSCTFNNNTVTGIAGANGVSGSRNGSNGGDGTGGAISSTGTLNCNSCTFTSNSATGGKGGNNFTGGNNGSGGDGKGGAISHTSMDIFLTDCTFNNNTATGGSPGSGSGGVAALYGKSSGGAVYVSSISSTATFDITRNAFNTNTALGGGNSSVSASIRKAGFGGAVSMDFSGSGSIEDSTFNNNMAHNGGAVFAFDSLFTISGSTCTSNIAQGIAGFGGTNGWGGVAYGVGDASSPGNLGGGTFTDCTLYNNTAVNGGAIASNGASNGTVSLTNCTLKTNAASSSGGNIYGAVSLANTIVSGGTPANFGSAPGQTSQGHNISDDAAGGGAGTGPGGFLNGTGDKRNTNPQLATTSPQDNGGFTTTFGLSNTSPAIDQGDDGLAPYRDQRGNFRTGKSDIGSFEYNGGFVGKSFIERDGNSAVVSAEVVYNNTYRLERKMNLTDAIWQDLSQTVDPIQATDNDVESITDPNGFSSTRGFYHIIMVPQ